jgi:hypothetical protein
LQQAALMVWLALAPDFAGCHEKRRRRDRFRNANANGKLTKSSLERRVEKLYSDPA